MLKFYGVLFSGTMALVSVIGFARFGYTPLLPIMMEQTDLSTQGGGFLASFNFMGYMLGALTPLFWKGDHVRFRMLRLGLVFTILAFLGFSATLEWPYQMYSWSFFRFVNGVASAWVLVSSSSIILEYLDKRGKKKLMGFLYAGVGIGALLSALMVYFIKDYFALNWNSYWHIFAAVCVFISIPVFLFIPPPKKSKSKVDPNVLSFAVINKKVVWLLALIYFCEGFSYIIIVTFFPLITEELGKLSEYAWLILAAVGIPSTVIWGFLSEKLGNINALKLAYGGQIFAFVLPLVFSNAFGALSSAFFLGFTFMGIVTLVLAQARILNPKAQTGIMALVTCIYSIGQIIGPGLAGFVAEATGGFNIPLIFGTVFLSIAFILLFLFERMIPVK